MSVAADKGKAVRCVTAPRSARLRSQLILFEPLQQNAALASTELPMTQVEDPVLRRFWFPVPGAFGIGVTAYTRAEAVALAEAVATRMGRTIDASAVLENVDIRSLDQGHVIPNMRPPNLRGVWFPAVDL